MKTLLLALATLSLLSACGKAPAPQQTEQAASPQAATPPEAAKAEAVPQVTHVCNVKADTVGINSGGSAMMIGSMQMSIGTGEVSGGPKRVHIWRDFTAADEPIVKQFNLAVGKAYLELPDRTLQYVCDVDLTLDDVKLAALFGATTKP